VDYQPITGTFLDEITVDIPSQNWGGQEWRREFDRFAADGIDTVVLIRAGCGERLACPSAAVSARVPTLPVYADLVELFLTLAGDRDIAFYFGLYDSNLFWYRYDWQREVEVNLAFIDEVWARYGGAPALRGWYLPHETTDTSLRILDINTSLARRLREVAPGLPIMVSPFFAGRADLWDHGDPRSRPREPDEHARIWGEIFGSYAGLVDICAFQDGTADLLRAADYFAVSAAAAARHGIRSWANVETFDRDMPIRFPPTDWRKLAHKLDAVQPHVEKVVSFELPHFLSPNSMWPSARGLYDRYREFLAGKQP
jgi:Domain of unknown function (DUF5109)/Domain of unknown function (DUF4434)